MQQHVNSTTPLAHQIPDACNRVGIGRTTFFELIRAGEIKTFKIGTRTLVTESELQQFIAKRVAQAA